LTGDPTTRFFTLRGSLIATGYTRVVIGERGPYVEFMLENLESNAMCESQDNRHYYYVELRSRVDNVKVYVQVHPVDYADYVPGRCYVSPFDMYDASGVRLIEPLNGS